MAELQPQDNRELVETLVARFPQEADNVDLEAARAL